VQDTPHIIEKKEITKGRHTSAEIRKSHVIKWKNSGLTMSAYCRQYNLSLSSFSGWVQMLENTKPQFKPIAIKTSTTGEDKPTNIIEIITAEHVKIRLLNVTDATFIARIAKELIKCS
jgi:hypothetical protein